MANAGMASVWWVSGVGEGALSFSIAVCGQQSAFAFDGHWPYKRRRDLELARCIWFALGPGTLADLVNREKVVVCFHQPFYGIFDAF